MITPVLLLSTLTPKIGKGLFIGFMALKISKTLYKQIKE